MENRKAELLSKQGKVVTQVADDLLLKKLDDRVPSMLDYAELFQASVGTIQSAVNYLQAEDAVEFKSRGRLGAFIASIDYSKLWSIARNRLIVSAQPLPYSRRLGGLATALRAQFLNHGVDANFRFVRGSNTRLQMLQSNVCDWVVVSRYAAETASIHGFEIDVAFHFGNNTYTSDQVLLVRAEIEPKLNDGLRIGIDMNSSDHAYLVRSITRNYTITFVEIEYQRGVHHLLAGEIDAAIWTSTDLPPSGVHVLEIDHQQSKFAQLNEAVIVNRPGDLAVKHVLREIVSMASIKQIQHEVVTSQRLASY